MLCELQSFVYLSNDFILNECINIVKCIYSSTVDGYLGWFLILGNYKQCCYKPIAIKWKNIYIEREKELIKALCSVQNSVDEWFHVIFNKTGCDSIIILILDL